MRAGLPWRVASASVLAGALGVVGVASAFGGDDGHLGAALAGALSALLGAVGVGLSARRTDVALRRAALDARALAGPLAGARTPLGPVHALDETAALARALASVRATVVAVRERDKRTREDAEEADRYKTDFLTAVSHELRTPLNAILGFSDVLLRELDGPLTEGAREDVETIRSAGAHLRELFEDVIDLSALSSSRVTLTREVVDAGVLVEETCRLLEELRRDRPVELHVSIAEDTPSVHADPKRLRQILTNLGANALKYTETGSIHFETRGEGDALLLVVRDTGVGIAPGDLDSLFSAYSQQGDARRRKHNSGLGLAISKHLIELHGGSIQVESSLGAGSAFTIRLPAHVEAADA